MSSSSSSLSSTSDALGLSASHNPTDLHTHLINWFLILAASLTGPCFSNLSASRCPFTLLPSSYSQGPQPSSLEPDYSSYNQARPQYCPRTPPFGFCSQVKPTSPDYKSSLSAKVDKRGQKCSFDFLEQAVFYDRLNLFALRFGLVHCEMPSAIKIISDISLQLKWL